MPINLFLFKVDVLFEILVVPVPPLELESPRPRFVVCFPFLAVDFERERPDVRLLLPSSPVLLLRLLRLRLFLLVVTFVFLVGTNCFVLLLATSFVVVLMGNRLVTGVLLPVRP